MPFPLMPFVPAAAGAIWGLTQEGHNDRRQRNQQQELQKIQIRGQKEMTDYEMMKQYEMWQKTGYGAQKEQMLKAGLNPALMYGMGGGGGQTAGNAAGSVSGGVAGGVTGESMTMGGMGLQTALTQANIRLMESQANKNDVEAGKAGGVDTEAVKQSISESQQRIATLKQEVQNKQAQEALTKAETFLKTLAGTITAGTMEEAMGQIKWNLRQTIRNVELAENEVYIKSETTDAIIESAKQEAIGAAIKNAIGRATKTNIEANTANTRKDTEKKGTEIQMMGEQMRKIDTEIQAMAIKVKQEWEQLSINERQVAINDFMSKIKANFPNIGEAAGKALNDAIDAIYKVIARNVEGADKERPMIYKR